MLRKEFGTGRGREDKGVARPNHFHGRGHWTRSTAQYAVFASLGERFVLIRWPRAGMEAAQRAIRLDMKAVRAEVCAAVHPLFDNLGTADPTVPRAMEQDQLPALGDFISYSPHSTCTRQRRQQEYYRRARTGVSYADQPAVVPARQRVRAA